MRGEVGGEWLVGDEHGNFLCGNENAPRISPGGGFRGRKNSPMKGRIVLLRVYLRERPMHGALLNGNIGENHPKRQV